MKKYLLIFIIGILFLLFVFWGESMVKCEIITFQHGDEFFDFEEVSTASEYKILTYTDEFARVYCVNFDKSNGSVHDFIKQGNVWIYNAWEDAGWSTSGSADDVIWPYWWHVVYFWF